MVSQASQPGQASWPASQASQPGWLADWPASQASQQRQGKSRKNQKNQKNQRFQENLRHAPPLARDSPGIFGFFGFFGFFWVFPLRTSVESLSRTMESSRKSMESLRKSMESWRNSMESNVRRGESCGPVSLGHFLWNICAPLENPNFRVYLSDFISIKKHEQEITLNFFIFKDGTLNFRIFKKGNHLTLNSR